MQLLDGDQFVDMLNRLGDGIFSVDRNWVVTYANAAASERGGMLPEDLTGQVLWEAIPVLVGTKIERIYRVSMETGHPAEFEIEGLNTGAWYQVRVYPTGNGLIIHFHDISAEKAAEEQRKRLLEELKVQREAAEASAAESMRAVEISRRTARESREASMEVETVLDNIGDAVLMFDRNDYIRRANAYAVALFGFDPVGYSYTLLFSRMRMTNPGGSPVPSDEDPYFRARSGEVVINLPVGMTNRRGRVFHILISVMPVYIGKQFNGIVMMLKDVTRITNEIEERRKVEQVLRESQDRLVLASEAAGIGAWERNLVSEALLWDNRCRALFGLAPGEEITHEKFLQIIYPDDRPRLMELLRMQQERAGSFEHEFRIIWPDGQVRWLFERGRSEAGENGDMGRVFGVTMDITERKEAEAEMERLLRQVEAEHAWLDTVLSELPVGVWIADHGGKMLRSNAQASAIWGGETPMVNSIDEMSIFRSWWPDTGDEVKPEDTPLARALLRGERTVGAEIEIQRFNGGRGINLVSASPVHSPEGEIMGGVMVEQDITARIETERVLKRSESELRENEARLRVALANAPVVVFGVDTNLRYTWIFGPSLKIDPQNFLGRTDAEVLSPGQAKEMMAFKKSVLQASTGMRGEFTFSVEDRTYVVLVYAEATRDPQGVVTGLTGAALDISEQRRLEAEQIVYSTSVEVQRRLLEQREAERQRIARDLHDGPIQNLVGVLFSLKGIMEDNHDPVIRETVLYVRDHLQNMVNELRHVCNELRPPTLMQLGLERAIRNHANEFRERFPGVKIFLDLMDDGSRLPERYRVALYRIYQEGLNNVVRHSEANQVIVRFALHSDHVALEIEDNGRGITVPLDWVDLARHGHLGLVGMKERAEAIGGVLTVLPADRVGTIVRVEAPL